MGAGASAKQSKYNGGQMNSLFKALEERDYTIASQLIFHGTDVNCINFDGETPLIVTCRITNDKEIEMTHFVKFLTANGADVKKIDIQGWTASMHARDNGYDEIAKFLEKMERKASYLNRKGQLFVLPNALTSNNENSYRKDSNSPTGSLFY